MGLFSNKPTQDIPRRRKVQTESEKEAFATRYTFRRSQTLTGSVSANIESVAGKDSHLKSPRERTHDLVSHRRQLLKIFGLIMIGVLALSIFMWQFIATVTVSTADSVAMQDSKRYQEVIQTYLGQRPAERFRVALNQQALLSYMTARLPEVENVTLAAPTGLASSSFEITMREPVAGWNMGGSQHFVDANGVAFVMNYYGTPPVQIIDNSGIPTDTGSSVASSRFLSFVGRIVSESRAYEYQVTSIVIPPGTTRQIEVRLDGIAYPIRFSVDRPVGEQVEDMARSLQYMRENGVSPEYIDVRVSRRAYYR